MQGGEGFAHGANDAHVESLVIAAARRAGSLERGLAFFFFLLLLPPPPLPAAIARSRKMGNTNNTTPMSSLPWPTGNLEKEKSNGKLV